MSGKEGVGKKGTTKQTKEEGGAPKTPEKKEGEAPKKGKGRGKKAK